MSDGLYRKELLRLAADAHAAGKLDRASGTGEAHNPVCGDRVTVDLIIDGDHVREIAQRTTACVLTQASASLLGLQLTGAKRQDVERLRDEVQKMLEGGPPPRPPFEAFSVFDAALAFPGRHACVLLPFEAVLAAFEASETSEPETIRS